jgi:hypothetical protein
MGIEQATPPPQGPIRLPRPMLLGSQRSVAYLFAADQKACQKSLKI